MLQGRNVGHNLECLSTFNSTPVIEFQVSKRSADEMAGRSESNVKVIVPQEEIPVAINNDKTAPIKQGSYVAIKVT